MEIIKNDIKKLIPAYILAFTFSFMLYIYEPILTYATNMNDIWFDFKTLFGAIIIYFFILFLLISLIYTIIYAINKKFSKKMLLYKIILLISYIVMILIYIQGNYLIGNLPALDGTTIDWSVYTKENVVLLSISIILLITEIIFIKKVNYDKVLKVNGFVIIAIFLMLMTSLVSKLFTPDLFEEKIVANSTIKNINMASTNKNFFIFLLDAVDSVEFEKSVNESGTDIFTDFTYYPDTVSGYTFTRDSLPFIFSGKWNENETSFKEYANNAYESSEIFKRLKNDNYNMNFYDYEVNWTNRKAEMFSNIEISNKDIYKLNLFKQLSKFILFKYLPYPLKHYSKIQTVDFNSCKIEQENALFKWDDSIAYELFKNEAIEKNDSNYFQFMHIEGAHTPFDYDENVNKISETEGTYSQKTKASLRIIEEFINRLRNNNVYDNSVIVIMADHGYWATPTTGRQNPILYIKGINENHEMKKSDLPISHVDLKDAFIDLLENKKSDELFKNIDINRTRRFIDNAFKSEDHMIEYEQRGKAWESSATVKTGREFNR